MGKEKKNSDLGLFGAIWETPAAPQENKPIVIGVSKAVIYDPVALAFRIIYTRPGSAGGAVPKSTRVKLMSREGMPLIKFFLPDGSIQAHNFLSNADIVTYRADYTSVDAYFAAVKDELQARLPESLAWGDQMATDIKKGINKNLRQLEQVELPESCLTQIVVRWSDVEKNSEWDLQIRAAFVLYEEDKDLRQKIDKTTDHYLDHADLDRVPENDRQRELSKRYLLWEFAMVRYFMQNFSPLCYQAEMTPLVDYAIQHWGKQLALGNSVIDSYFCRPTPLLDATDLSFLEGDPIYAILKRKIEDDLKQYSLTKACSVGQKVKPLPLLTDEQIKDFCQSRNAIAIARANIKEPVEHNVPDVLNAQQLTAFFMQAVRQAALPGAHSPSGPSIPPTNSKTNKPSVFAVRPSSPDTPITGRRLSPRGGTTV